MVLTVTVENLKGEELTPEQVRELVIEDEGVYEILRSVKKRIEIN